MHCCVKVIQVVYATWWVSEEMGFILCNEKRTIFKSVALTVWRILQAAISILSQLFHTIQLSISKVDANSKVC